MEKLNSTKCFKDDSALFYSERKDYLDYKKGNLAITKFSERLNYEILEKLEAMGFSADGYGIYFYKDVIVRIIKRLEWLDSDGYCFILEQIDPDLIKQMSDNDLKEFIKMKLNNYLEYLKKELEYLKKELKDPYSQFYFDIARNDNDISTKAFHSYIVRSFSTLDINQKNFDISQAKNNLLEGKVDYGKLAFEIAEYIRNLDFYKNTTEEKEKLRPMMRIKM